MDSWDYGSTYDFLPGMKRIRSQDLDPELRVRIITFLEGRDHWAPLKDIVAGTRRREKV